MTVYSCIYIKLSIITLIASIFKVIFKTEPIITEEKITLPDITKHTKLFLTCLPPVCFRITHHVSNAKRVSFVFPNMPPKTKYNIILITESKSNSVPYCKTIFSSTVYFLLLSAYAIMHFDIFFIIHHHFFVYIDIISLFVF